MKIEREFVVISCCSCGVDFAVTVEYKKELRECHNFFYCPNGHAQHYTKLNPEEQLLKERDAALKRAQRAEEETTNVVRSQAALRGVITKMRKKSDELDKKEAD